MSGRGIHRLWETQRFQLCSCEKHFQSSECWSDSILTASALTCPCPSLSARCSETLGFIPRVILSLVFSTSQNKHTLECCKDLSRHLLEKSALAVLYFSSWHLKNSFSIKCRDPFETHLEPCLHLCVKRGSFKENLPYFFFPSCPPARQLRPVLVHFTFSHSERRVFWNKMNKCLFDLTCTLS